MLQALAACVAALRIPFDANRPELGWPGSSGWVPAAFLALVLTMVLVGFAIHYRGRAGKHW